MSTFNGSIVLPHNTVKTLRELIREAIAARTHASAAHESDALLPFGGGTIREGFIRPTADVYMMDAYKGVQAGEAVAADWTTPDDFTDAPGGGDLLAADTDKHFNHGVDLGNRVLYQNSGGDVTIYVDMSFS